MKKIVRHQKLGQAGESFAAEWLRLKGFEIRAQNYHSVGGEIDIIAYDRLEQYYLMVEVKTRHNHSGIGAINSQKIRRMKNAAEHYFFKKLDLQYAPDFEIWGLCLSLDQGQLRVVDWVAL